MIRRGFWFLLGAVLGVSGYRKLTRTAKALLPHGELVSQLHARTPVARPGRRAGSGTIAFVRDVRTGMADYLDRHREI
jgi:hypothetical protein